MSTFKKILPFIFISIFTSVQAAPELLTDPNVISGTLDNGLTYHLYESNDEEKDDHNEEVSLRLYVKIGSLDENEEQKGFAHLVEHLGFRDSRYFTHKQKNEFLENLGLHTNAYTTFNRTVYYVNDRKITPERMDKHIKLFRDFADGMIITQSDFEVERKIVLEELRLRAAKKDGISEKLNEIYDNGQYLDDKKPIGTKETLNAATQASVKEFMDTWYQPQHMHLIITGQIDAKTLEQKIIAEFSQIESAPAVKQAAPHYELPTGVHYATADDSTNNSISILLPIPTLEGGVQNAEQYEKDLYFGVVADAIRSRMQHKNDTMNKELPFIGAGIGIYEGRLFIEVQMFHKEGENKRNEAVKFALDELAYIREYGLNNTQFKTQLEFMERRIDEPYSPYKKDGRPSEIADELIEDMEYDYINVSEDSEKEQLVAFIADATLAPANELIKQVLDSQAIMVVVSREAVLDAEQTAAKQLINAFNDRSMAVEAQRAEVEGNKQLAKIDLPSGSIISEEIADGSPLIQLKLSNGATAYLLQRKKDAGHVNVAAYAKGGTQSLPLNLYHASIFANNVLSASGLGGLTQQELSEYARKARMSHVQPFVGNSQHGFSAKVEKTENLEDLFNVLHRSFYQAQIHKGQFDAVIAANAESVAKWLTTEQGQYSQMMVNELYQTGKEYYVVDPKIIKATKPEEIKQVYQQLYGDLSKFHFVVAGDFEVEHVKTLLEKYIANIPTQITTGIVADIKLHDRDLTIRATNNPKEQSRVLLNYHVTDYDKTYSHNVGHVIAAKALSKRITDILRKEEGLTYSVRVNFQSRESDVRNSTYAISFSVKPSNEKQAIEIVDTALQNLIDNPISKEEFEDMRDKLLLDHDKVRNSNASEVHYAGRKLAIGYGAERLGKIKSEIKAIKYEDMRDGVIDFFAKSKRISAIFSSEKAPK